jgi:uncharacterized protein (TIGR03437 family)
LSAHPSTRIVSAGLGILFFGLARPAAGQSYTIYTLAGGGQQSNVLGTSPYVAGRQLNFLTADRTGNLFFASDSQVLRMDAVTGVVTVVAGTNGTGFSGDGGPAVLAQLAVPQGLAFDAAGNLYVADSGNHRIRKITNGIISTIAGNGSRGTAGNNGPAINAQLDLPLGLAVDSSGSVYVADPNSNSIRRISNGVISVFAGTGTAGYSGDRGPAASAQLSAPYGVCAAAEGTIYVADTSNSVIRAVSQGTITTVAGTPVRGPLGDNGPATSATIIFPTDVAVDAAGNLYIADASGNRVRKVSGGLITTTAGNGASGFDGDGGPAVSAKLSGPRGVAVDSVGNLYLSDNANFRIRRVTNGMISTVVGSGLAGFAGNNGPAIAASFSNPGFIARDSSGNLYFSNGFGHRVFKISSGVLTVVAGTGVAGFSGDDGPATSAQLNVPTGLAVDEAGNIYIADAANNRIRRVTDGIITTVAGTGAAGLSGDGGPGPLAQLSYPTSLLLDPAFNLYISDSNNHRIRRLSNGVINTFAGTTAGLSGDNGPPAKAQLNSPAGLAFDSIGNLYVADSGNARIRRISYGIITTFAGSAAAGLSDGDGGLPTQAHFNDPTGVAVDAAGNLYVADYQAHRIRKISNSSGIISTISGNGTAGFSGDSGPAAKALLNSPSDVTVDSTGSVYVTDLANQRVRVLVPDGTACAYDVTPKLISAQPSGGDFELRIGAATFCPWKVDGLPDWMIFSSAAATAQLATVQVTALPNNGTTRGATFSIGGVPVQISQTGKGLPSINAGGVLNAASSAVGGALSPGGIATAYGVFPVNGVLSAAGIPLPPNLGGISFQFAGGVTAPLYNVTGGQASFQVPWELAGQTQVALSPVLNGQAGSAVMVRLAPFAPGIFSMNAQGTGQGAVLDAGYRLVDASNPAIAGKTVIQIFCTGLGAVTNQPPTGAAASSDPLSYTTNTPAVTVGGAPASVLFSGLTPFAVGLYQVNVLVPAESAKGAAVPVSMGISGASSNMVTIAVQ